MKNDTIFANEVQLLLEDERNAYEALASVTLNPNVTWIKFILLDDQPNGNKQRVPAEEFNNVLRTGIHMPVKVAPGIIEETHANASALGSITHLYKDKNTIKGLAALWNRERPDDVIMLKKRFEDGETLNLSWEVTYKESKFQDDIEDMIGISMNAATFVGMPAYGGRTPVMAIASNDGNNEEEKDVPEINNPNPSEEELEQEVLETQEEELPVEETPEEEPVEETPAEEAPEEEQEEEEPEEEDALADLQKKFNDLEAEVQELREYKATAENAKLEAQKFASIKEKFQEAGLQLSEEYFDERREQFLGMEDSIIEFMIQEMVAFNSKNTSASQSQVPHLGFSAGAEDLSPKELAKRLRQK